MTTTQIRQNQLAAPTAVSATDNATTGTLTATSFFWKVTATGPSGVESPPSAEATLAATLNHSANVIFTPPAGATGFRVYRGPTGAEDHLVGQGSCTGGVSTTFVDSGAAGTVAAMPAAQALTTVAKTVSVPTKAPLLALGLPVGQAIELYQAISMWLCDAVSATSVPTTTTQAQLGKKRAAAAGFLLQET